METPHGPTTGVWRFDTHRQTYYRFDAQRHEYIYADGQVIQQPGYSKPQVFPPAHREYYQPAQTSRAAPPPPPPNNYQGVQSTQSVNPGYSFPYQPPGSLDSPPPPSNYHHSRPSYVLMPSRPPESVHSSTDPRYAQAHPSLLFGQSAYQQQPPPPPPPPTYYGSDVYGNGGSGEDQNDRNRHGRNHFQDNNPPVNGGQPNGRDRVDDGDETQSISSYYRR